MRQTYSKKGIDYYSGAFERFDPITGELPDILYVLCGDIVRRSQAILKDRDRPQLDYALESLGWMLTKGDESLSMPQSEDSTAMTKGDELLIYEAIAAINTGEQNDFFLTPAKALQGCMSKFDIKGQKSLPKATWADYFAAMALAHIGEAVNIEFEYSNSSSLTVQPADNNPCIQFLPLAHAVTEAMEAVCYGEQLNTRRQKSSNTAKVRTKKYDNLRRKVIDIYTNKYTGRNNRNAAMRIWGNDLLDSDRNILTTDDPTKRLEKWIGDYKKKQIDE